MGERIWAGLHSTALAVLDDLSARQPWRVRRRSGRRHGLMMRMHHRVRKDIDLFRTCTLFSEVDLHAL